LRPSKPLKSISIAFQNGDIQQKVLLNMRFTLISKIKNRFFLVQKVLLLKLFW
jgi:hypothetical protein